MSTSNEDVKNRELLRLAYIKTDKAKQESYDLFEELRIERRNFFELKKILIEEIKNLKKDNDKLQKEKQRLLDKSEEYFSQLPCLEAEKIVLRQIKENIQKFRFIIYEAFVSLSSLESITISQYEEFCNTVQEALGVEL